MYGDGPAASISAIFQMADRARCAGRANDVPRRPEPVRTGRLSRKIPTRNFAV